MWSLGKNGVLVLTGISGGDRELEVPGDRILLGSVNADRSHFEIGVRDTALAEARYPGWLGRLLTYEEMIRLLTEEKGAIKVFVEVKDGA